MMYSNKFVATLKHNGKVLREQGDTVYLPFGSEYSVLLKNLNTVRAIATIEIDGTNIGSDIVIGPNSEINIERFLGNLDKGNRFKFIERTSDIEQHRGVGATDGIIRIQFEFEKPYIPPIFTPRPDPFTPTWSNPNTPWYGVTNNASYNASIIRGQTMSIVPTGATACNVNDVGITVPGSVSNQQFHHTSRFPTDGIKHAIVLQLKGETEYNKVTKPVTVKTKPKCITCGKVNKATAKFCSGCGTSLTLI